MVVRAASMARRISVSRRAPQRLRRLPECPDERTILSLVSGLAVVAAVWLWPAHHPEAIAHSHRNLTADLLHLKGTDEAGRRAHAYIIDDLYRSWPRAVGMRQ